MSAADTTPEPLESTIADNIASPFAPQDPGEKPKQPSNGAEVDIDSYVKRFGDIADKNDAIYAASNALEGISLAEWRSRVNGILAQQAQINAEILALVTEMNNVFAK